MKKLIVAVIGVLFFAPSVSADNWGLGVKLGAGENDPKTIKEVYGVAVTSKEKDEDPTFGGVEAFYEWNLNDENNKLGVKVGIEGYGENSVELKTPVYLEITETTMAIPVTLYYKRDNGIKNWSFYGGAGATWLYSELEGKGLVNAKEHKSKVFPHIAAGAEYRFTHLFALGVDARYNFSAKTTKDGDILTDRTGFGAAITGRFYF